MIPEEQAQQHGVAEAAKAAWIAGFTAARHYPNHALPELVIRWDGNTPHIEPNWTRRLPGYVG